MDDQYLSIPERCNLQWLLYVDDSNVKSWSLNETKGVLPLERRGCNPTVLKMDPDGSAIDLTGK